MFNKKIIKNNFLSLAYFERESDLKRKWAKNYKSITPVQRTWTRYMLNLWGSKYGGNFDNGFDYENVIHRFMLKTHWNDRESEKIITIITRLYEEGYRGDELFTKAKTSIMPNRSSDNLISSAIASDDADFVETVLSNEFSSDNPVKILAIKYFCDGLCQQKIAKELSLQTGIDISSAIRRIKWGLGLLEGTIFHAMNKEMEKENNIEKIY